MCGHTGASFWCAGRCEGESEQPAEDSLWPWVGSLDASALSVTHTQTHTHLVTVFLSVMNSRVFIYTAEINDVFRFPAGASVVLFITYNPPNHTPNV